MSKKMYVWENVDGLTQNYHDGGGAVVIADSLDVARELLEKQTGKGCSAMKDEPSYSAPVEAEKDEVFIFPDAGCC